MINYILNIFQWKVKVVSQ